MECAMDEISCKYILFSEYGTKKEGKMWVEEGKKDERWLFLVFRKQAACVPRNGHVI